MKAPYDKYEMVVGLETHVQLCTASKAFCADPATYGAAPNTQVSPVSLGHPGTLPFVNKKMVEYAVRMGLAVQANISRQQAFARKNYFYADLPKGYQITQDTDPVCTGGSILIRLRDGREKEIRIHHIHLEEDAGKSMHDQDEQDSLIDLNRAGVPLIEIVSEPDIRSGEEAYQYFSEIRKLVRYLDISDGNMEEGSLRCDANVSVRLKGDPVLGTRCEVKNLNSIRHVQRAVEYEFRRQVDLLEAGGRVVQQTLNYDAVTGKTSPLRLKEEANDYRYFPDPDIPLLVLSEAFLRKVRESMPPLPEAWRQKLMSEYGLSGYDASLLSESKEMVTYFEAVIQHAPFPKFVANWLLGPVSSWLNEHRTGITQFPLEPAALAGLILLIEEGKVNHSVAVQQVFPVLLQSPGSQAADVAAGLGVMIDTDPDKLHEIIDRVLLKYPEKVGEYQAGKKGLLGMFMGEVMKISKGKIEPKSASALLKQKLENK